MKTLLPYEGIPLEDGIEQLSDATWYTISECFLLMSWIIAESDDHIKKEIIHCAATLPGCCRSMQLAFYIGTVVRSEGKNSGSIDPKLSDMQLSNNQIQLELPGKVYETITYSPFAHVQMDCDLCFYFLYHLSSGYQR